MREIKSKANKTSFQKGHTGFRGDRNPMWRGGDACYESKHERIYVRFGRPRKCERCGTETAKKYEWANLSGNFLDDRTDWIRLCTSCHRLFDGHGFKMWETRRAVNA